MEEADGRIAALPEPGGEIAGPGVVGDDRLGPPEGVFLNLTFLTLYRHGESTPRASTASG